MKPELMMQDFRGTHNADIITTGARLKKSASWKQTRIVVIIPAGESIPAKVALSHWNLIFPPNQGVVRILAQGMEVGAAYSAAIDGVLSHPDLSQWEYILTIEHDNMPPQDGLLKLIETLDERTELAAVGGLYFTKGEGGCAQIWGDVNDPVLNFRPQVPVPDQVVECCGTGMGFTLFRASMFKDERLRRPLFATQTEGGLCTQDLYFWGDARKYGYRAAVDCRVKVGHYDMGTGVVW